MAIFRVGRLAICLTLGVGVAALSACGNAPPSAGEGGTGSISARLVFPTAAEPTYGPLAAAPLAAPDLSGQVDTIRLVAVPRAGIGSSVSATFDYTARQGILSGVPVGSNCTLRVEGIGGGVVRYRAVRAPILVEKGVTTTVGDVPMVKVKSGTCVFLDSGQTLATPGLIALAIGPMDGGTTPDLVTVSGTGSNKIWLNNGSGTFSATARNIGGLSTAVMAANLDTVVGADIVTAQGNSLTFWFNDGAGYFATTGPGFGGDQTLAIAAGDVNEDGNLDVVAGNYNADWILFNGPPGTFNPVESNLAPATDNAVALGDMDGDGDLDLVVADTIRSGVWRNDGSGAFPTSTALFPASPHGTEGVALGDVDGDGDLDIVLAMNGEPNRLFLNNGSGVFTDSGQDLGTWWTMAVALGDVDGDGDPDIVFGVNNGPSRVFVNAGDGAFQESGMELGSASDETLDAALADLDGDGDLDLVLGNHGGTSRVYVNRTTDGPATGKLYFEQGSDLWSYDGNAAALVATLQDANMGNQLAPIPVGEDLVFSAYHTTEVKGYNPWVFRSATGGTEMINLQPWGGLGPQDWAIYHEALWISAHAGSGWGYFTYPNYSYVGHTFNSYQSWDTDQRMQDMFVFNDHLYWVVTDSSDDRDLWDHFTSSAGPAIWYIDKVDINPSGPFDIESGNGVAVASSGNRLFMSARTMYLDDDGTGSFNELYVTSNPGYYTSLVRNIHPSGYPTELHPLSLAFFNGQLHFSANAAAYMETTDIGLWTYDGTKAPEEITVPEGFEVDGKLVPCGGKLFFVGTKKINTPSFPFFDWYRLIWSYDGSGTFDSIQPNPSGDSNPFNLTAFGERLVFVAEDEVERELWEYDVAADILRKVQVNPAGSSSPGPMTPWLRLIPD